MRAILTREELMRQLLAAMGPQRLVVQRTFWPGTSTGDKPRLMEIFALTSPRSGQAKQQRRRRPYHLGRLSLSACPALIGVENQKFSREHLRARTSTGARPSPRSQMLAAKRAKSEFHPLILRGSTKSAKKVQSAGLRRPLAAPEEEQRL